MFKLKEIFFCLGILWTTTLPPGLARTSTPRGSDEVPELMLVYPMANFPIGRIETCPDHSKAVWLDRRGEPSSSRDRPRDSRGLTCVPDPETEYDYNISVPLMTEHSMYWPRRLTLTVNQDEDVIVRFEKADPGRVNWQKEPVNKYKKYWLPADLTDANEVVLHHAKLDGSGFYTFLDIDRPNFFSNKGHFSTVAIIIRECAKDKYGKKCKNWCPDCLYGGVCHDRTGKCVCPPGREGDYCQQACDSGFIGRTCHKEQIPMKEVLICLPSPYGCSCAPGFKGFRCNETCDESHWGVDCSQSCGHCTSNECESETGHCSQDDQEHSCAGGPLGLPRLRNEPIVNPQSYSADVSFDEEETDGELPDDAVTEGYQIVVWENDEDMKDGITYDVSNNPTSITSLVPGTAYHLAVLVKVRLGNDLCTENGTFRGVRIHKPSFKTSCPEEPPAPSNVTINNVTQTSFVVSWKEIDFWKSCNINFLLKVHEKSSGKEMISENIQSNSYTVKGLSSYTDYSVQIQSARTINHHVTKSEPVDRVQRTLPKSPDAPSEPQIVSSGNNKVTFTLEKPDGAEGNIYYQYRYKITYKACDEEGKFEEVSNTTDTSLTLPHPPYSTLLFRLRVGNEAGMSNTTEATFTSDSKVPEIKVTSTTCSSDCKVYLEKDCEKINGEGLTVNYKFEAVEESVRNREKEVNGIERIVDSVGSHQNLENKFQWDVDLPDNLYPNTEYKFTAHVANGEGRNEDIPGLDTSFTTKSVVPKEVTNVDISTAHDSLKVTWDPPPQWPRTGNIEEYKVIWSWYESRWSSPSEERSTSEQKFDIEGLKPDTYYTVKIYAKNKGVEDYGNPTTSEAKTVLEKPSPPQDVQHNSSRTNIWVQWEDSETDTKYSLSYTLTLQGEDYNTDDKNFKFSDLNPDRNYNLTMKTCNQYVCSDNIIELLSTQPSRPKVEETVEVKASGNTSKLTLPKVENPPAWQYVVVIEDNGDLDAATMRSRSEEIAKEYDETQHADHHLNKRNVDDPITEKPKGWVAGKIHVKDNNTPQEFTIGTGKGDNQAFEANKEYQVVVVTEKKSGPHRDFVTTNPVNARGPAIASALTGILFGILIFLILIVLFAWTYRKNQNKIIVRTPEEDTDAILPVHVDPPNKSERRPGSQVSVRSRTQEGIQRPPLPWRMSSKTFEEPIYANVCKRTPFAEIESYLSKSVHSNDLDEEFNSVPKDMEMTSSHGEHAQNRLKNRYKNNLPYNETRVRLPRLPEQAFTDYINANYVQGHLHPNAYIATQGPKDFNKDTIDDFWRMIWHVKSKIIIMVANLLENGKVKVAQYWPGEEPIMKGGLEIKLIHTEVQVDFIIRTFLVTKGQEVRQVVQYQYTTWPDHDVPQNAFGLAQMINNIRREPQIEPIVVHCSAGIGRTGTLLLVMGILDQINISGYMDAHEILTSLRNGRARLVENTMQYKFGHQLLQEILFGEETSYSCSDYVQALPELRAAQDQTNMSTIQQQFLKIKAMPRDLTFKFGQKPGCAHLNRNPNILPADNRLAFLQSLDGREESQYINAVWVRSIDQKNAFLAAEHPQQHTVDRMWRLVYERRIAVWTLIHTFPEDDQEYPAVFPNDNQEMIGNFAIAISFRQEYENFIEYHVTITLSKSTRSVPHKCVVVMMKGWPYIDSQPSSVMPLLSAMERAESLITASAVGLFTCKDGVTGCGLILAMMQVIGRIRLLQEVDVYRSVLGITYDRPEFIVSEKQYDLVHEGVAQYLSCYSNYSNFTGSNK